MIGLILSLLIANAQAGAVKDIIVNAANQQGVSAKLLSALCWVESSHRVRTKLIIDRNRPSYGICQVQLRTARHFGYLGTAKQLQDPKTNAFWAATVLKHWLSKSNGNWRQAVSAYNRGHWSKRLRLIYVVKITLAMMENR